ncbi:group II intron reverse transcriptase/maturase [Xenorhabdus miraniensis]|uniref:Group II intron reverse transcriptase/maturase n=1 Tax=Xenorhabdus miraniensis TaxID=351674 RepID=A0A2D0JWV5_9GAMM|nr:group II intron reverse transcriptase/maturase [Xenorhabdus miraniensis]
MWFNTGPEGVDGQTITDFESNLKDNLYKHKFWNHHKRITRFA